MGLTASATALVVLLSRASQTLEIMSTLGFRLASTRCMDDGSQHGCECMALRRHYLAVTSFAAGLGRRSVAQMEPAAKAARVEADGPTLTAYSMAGAVLWGPSKVHKGMTVAELASTLDRPSTSPGLKILASFLEPISSCQNRNAK